jgi:hypothetical protein
VLVSNSEFGYRLLPYLRSQFPEVLFLDYCHMEEEGWDHGGYPRLAVQMQELLDVNVVSSTYLKTWETRRGGDRPNRSVRRMSTTANGSCAGARAERGHAHPRFCQ